MRTFDHGVPESGTQRWRAIVVNATLALGTCAMVAAAPVGVSSVDGDLVLTWQAAAAQGKGNGGGNGNGNGNGGGNGGGGAGGGGTGGTGGGGTGGNSASSSNASSGGESDGGSDRDGGRVFATTTGVVIAQFTTQISKRKPANHVSEISDPHQAVSFFTQVEGMEGHSVTHRWIHRGVIVYQTSFEVGGSNWRVWSTQLLPVDKPGDWRVEIVDDANKVLQTRSLEFRPTS